MPKAKNVAVACGFNDISYFCRAYKNKYEIKTIKNFKFEFKLLTCIYLCDKMMLFTLNALVAELADAHGSGPCESNFMGVQVSPGAP